MANRNTLAIIKLEDFKDWLRSRNIELLEPKGDYEVLRFKSDLKGQAMPVIFKKSDAKTHLSCNESAYGFVTTWLRVRKEQS